MNIEAYNGVSGAQHQAKVTELSSLGYGMISLSVYGDPGSPQYAAVWVDRPMPKWVAVHGISPAEYQTWFDQQVADGYAASLVTATGSGGSAIFAAVMTKGITGSWVARHGISQAEFDAENSSALAGGMMPHCVANYGDPASPTYAGVWRANPGFVKWHVHSADPEIGYQTTFNTETQLPGIRINGWRPTYVTLSNDQTYCSLFTDDVVGRWVARHNMTPAEYQSEFNAQKQAGNYPICLQGGGTGGGTRYAAIFAKHDLPARRHRATRGHPAPTLVAIDDAMREFMRANAVRAAQVAVGRNGTIVLDRGYTWAEPEYRVTKTNDRFLLASVSKMFCEAAIQSLFDSGQLHPDTLAYATLGFSNPADARSDTITIQQLLDHTAGYNDSPTTGPPVEPEPPANPPSNSGSGFDPTYQMNTITLQDHLAPPPLTKLDIARYMYARPLQFTPGTAGEYSNYGYLLLATIVEQVSGQDYFSYLKSTLLVPEGITEVGVFSTLASGRTEHEAIAEDPDLGQNALDPNSPLQVPAVYGGDGQIHELGIANEGLSASARALVKFAHLHAVWGNGPRAPGSTRFGSTPGASTAVWSRNDGVDAAFALNTRSWPPGAPSSIVADLQTKLDGLMP